MKAEKASVYINPKPFSAFYKNSALAGEYENLLFYYSLSELIVNDSNITCQKSNSIPVGSFNPGGKNHTF